MGRTTGDAPRGGSVDLLWIPLGAGGNGFVRTNGRVYERVSAWRDRRRPAPLFHSALDVVAAGERYVIENAWPSPDADTQARGVVLEGPVFAQPLSRARAFRYEVRRWRGGEIPDADDAVGGPLRLAGGARLARAVLNSVDEVPPYVWGRDSVGAGEMWNSNSLVSFVLSRAGVDASSLTPPDGGRAPGWRAGIVAAGSGHAEVGGR